MKAWYKIKNDMWKLLPVSFDSMMLTKEIDKVSISTFQIPERMYETMFSGLNPVPKIEEGFEDHTVGIDVMANASWTGNIPGVEEDFASYAAGDAISTKHGARITWGTATVNTGELKVRSIDMGLGASNALRHYDIATNNGNVCVGTFDTPSPEIPNATNQYFLSLRVHCATVSGNAYQYILGLGDNTSPDRLWIAFQHGDDSKKIEVYSGAAWVDTGLVTVADTPFLFDIWITGANKCKVRKDSGAWSAEMTAAASFNGQLTKIKTLTGNTARSDTYIDNIATSWSAMASANIIAGNHFNVIDAMNDGNVNRKYAFTQRTFALGDWASFKFKAVDDGIIYVRYQTAVANVVSFKLDNGNIYLYSFSTSAFEDTTLDYEVGEWYTLKFTCTDFSAGLLSEVSVTLEGENGTWYKYPMTNSGGSANMAYITVQTVDADTGIDFEFDDFVFSWVTETRGWTMDNEDWPFMKVIVMDDAYNPNVDVHEVPYIWFGQCIRINGDELNTFITCEEIHGSFMREVIAEDDNTVPGGPYEIDSFDSASVLVLTTSPFDIDGEIGRACRITAREPEGKVVVPASFSITVTGWNSNGTKTETGAYADCIIDNDDFYGVRIIGTSDDAVALEAIMEFSVERFPQRDMKIRLKGEFFANFNTPSLSIYNYVTTNYDLVQNVGPEIGALSSSPTNFIIPIVDVDLDKYYNESTKKMKFKLYSIYPLNTNTIMEIYYIALEYNAGYQHDPVEFKIEDNAVDDITIVDVADEFDLVTERINEGDSVDVIYKNDEWLEDIIVDYAISIAEIDAPASTSPTYSNKRNRIVGRDLSDTARLEGWFFRLSAELKHGFPILEFLDKTTLSGESYTLNSGYIIESNVKWAFNALDKLRKVIVDNGEINGESTELTAYPLNPVGVVTWKDVKAFIIDDIAQNIHDYRSAVTGNFEFMYDGTDFDEILPGDEVVFNIYSKELDSNEEITLVVRKVDVFRNRVKLTIGFNETERKPVNEMINDHLNRLTR